MVATDLVTLRLAIQPTVVMVQVTRELATQPTVVMVRVTQRLVTPPTVVMVRVIPELVIQLTAAVAQAAHHMDYKLFVTNTSKAKKDESLRPFYHA